VLCWYQSINEPPNIFLESVLCVHWAIRTYSCVFCGTCKLICHLHHWMTEKSHWPNVFLCLPILVIYTDKGLVNWAGIISYLMTITNALTYIFMWTSLWNCLQACKSEFVCFANFCHWIRPWTQIHKNTLLGQVKLDCKYWKGFVSCNTANTKVFS